MAGLFRASILGLVLLTGAGCAGPTPYQKAEGRSGLGYSDYRVRGNIYHVSISGVPVGNSERYREYWNRRSKELCEGLGFQEYRVLEYKQDEGDPTPVEKSDSVPFDRLDPRRRPPELVKDYSRAASVSGEVECLKKGR